MLTTCRAPEPYVGDFSFCTVSGYADNVAVVADGTFHWAEEGADFQFTGDGYWFAGDGGIAFWNSPGVTPFSGHFGVATNDGLNIDADLWTPGTICRAKPRGCEPCSMPPNFKP
jgi:hypothetical protein